MELQQLRYFHEVAQTQHMTNSAKHLGIAQPALTQAMRRLEGEVGAKLFERAGRNIRLTPCGQALEEHVAPLIEKLDQIPGVIASAQGRERNVVRIDIEAATSMTVDAIAAFRRTLPSTAFVINQSNANARWDVRIRTVPTNGQTALEPQAPGTRARHAFTESIALAVPKERAHEGRLRLAELADAPFVCLAGTRDFRALTDSLCAQAGFRPNVVFESDSPDVVRKFIGLGLGVGFWPERSWGGIDGTDVVLMPIDDDRFARTIIVEAADHLLQQKAAEFHAFLLSYFTERFQE